MLLWAKCELYSIIYSWPSYAYAVVQVITHCTQSNTDAMLSAYTLLVQDYKAFDCNKKGHIFCAVLAVILVNPSTTSQHAFHHLRPSCTCAWVSGQDQSSSVLLSPPYMQCIACCGVLFPTPSPACLAASV